jgi:hypothetical protein
LPEPCLSSCRCYVAAAPITQTPGVVHATVADVVALIVGIVLLLGY